MKSLSSGTHGVGASWNRADLPEPGVFQMLWLIGQLEFLCSKSFILQTEILILAGFNSLHFMFVRHEYP